MQTQDNIETCYRRGNWSTWALQAPTTNGLLRVLSSLVIQILQFWPIASATQWLLPMLPIGTKTSLNTQNGWGKCLD